MNEAAARSTHKLVQTLERKLVVLQELHGALSSCRDSFVSMNLDSIYAHVAAQAMICEKLKMLEAEQNAEWHALHNSDSPNGEPLAGAELRNWLETLDPALAYGLGRTLTSLAIVEADVRHINHAHSVLLQGTRRTLKIMSNAFAGMAPTYVPPRAAKESGWPVAHS
jgi:hypothetical protein